MHNNIQQLILNTFNTIGKSGKPAKDQFTVLAGLVVSDQVVALGTGLSCRNHLQLSDQGDIVNDCHAEVLCIRSFRAFLYHQMFAAIKSENSILEWNPSAAYPFRLVKGLELDLYISQAPCGDASMNILEDRQSEQEIFDNRNNVLNAQNMNNSVNQLLPNENISGIVYRGRMDYSIRGVARTKPGRIDSIPTLSMSCSDKILLWSMIGVSGSLLSLLIEPIYISSISVADGVIEDLEDSFRSRRVNVFTNYNHKKRKIDDDCGERSPFIEYFKSGIPKIYSCTQEFKFSWSQSQSSPCLSSIIWNPIDGSQVLDVRGMKLGTSKKNSKKVFSFVCNLELFTRFSNLIALLSQEEYLGKADFNLLNLNLKDCESYLDFKIQNTKYQKAKDISVKQGIKGWIRKNPKWTDFKI